MRYFVLQITHFFLIVVLLLQAGCAQETILEDNYVRKQVERLQLISDSFTAAIESDFASCSGPDVSDTLIQKMCEVAQASTVEAQVELQAQIASFVQSLQDQIDVINLEQTVQQADLDNIFLQLASLESRMDDAESAIAALESLTSSLSGQISGSLLALQVGNENVGAGPLYETVMRRQDRTSFVGFILALGNPLGLGSNPLTASNGSPNITVSATAHGYSAGDVVQFSGLSGGRGFSNGHVFGEFVVVAPVAANTFTIVAKTSATSNGSFGGSTGNVQKVLGRGMGTLWNAGQVSDSAVRVTNLGSKRYNFLIRRRTSDLTNQTAELCYSKTDNAAIFATINAAPEGGNGTVACK